MSNVIQNHKRTFIPLIYDTYTKYGKGGYGPNEDSCLSENDDLDFDAHRAAAGSGAAGGGGRVRRGRIKDRQTN